MESKSGKSVYAGVAIGKIYFLKKEKKEISNVQIKDADAEILRFQQAKKTAIKQLQSLYEKSLNEVGEEQAAIFEVHQMMLDDGDYNEAIEGTIQDEKMNAEYAVNQTGIQFAEIFAAMDDDYMKARSADVKDISSRIISILNGAGEAMLDTEEPVIILAEDLAPSETVQLDKSKILAFVTKKGSSNSHTAILARTMNIPSIVNCDIDLKEEYHGKTAIVDGFSGTLYLEPEETLLNEMKQKQEEVLKERELLQQLKGKENITKNGTKINLYANIGNAEDVSKAIENDAGGIGLFRSEFLYLGRETYPSEEEQFKIYKEVVSKMNPKKVIIRTLDIGADKQADYFGIEKEENPAMGYRAIRICLDRVDMFKTQLRAIYRASAFGTVSIMFPMIISVDEIVKIKQITEEVKEELNQKELPFGAVELGIMIETPAAVMISDDLAKEVDFFSIGTNDLTQYTLAIDRQNEHLDEIYNPHHKAVLKMIQMTVENAHKEGKWAGICGELASDETLTDTFLSMGVDELSVSPSFILKIRKQILESSC